MTVLLNPRADKLTRHTTYHSGHRIAATPSPWCYTAWYASMAVRVRLEPGHAPPTAHEPPPCACIVYHQAQVKRLLLTRVQCCDCDCILQNAISRHYATVGDRIGFLTDDRSHAQHDEEELANTKCADWIVAEHPARASFSTAGTAHREVTHTMAHSRRSGRDRHRTA